ncbi:hypothetical protein TNIN_169351, partial [Trichonephila inaurata madagascariensis]
IGLYFKRRNQAWYAKLLHCSLNDFVLRGTSQIESNFQLFTPQWRRMKNVIINDSRRFEEYLRVIFSLTKKPQHTSSRFESHQSSAYANLAIIL